MDDFRSELTNQLTLVSPDSLIIRYSVAALAHCRLLRHASPVFIQRHTRTPRALCGDCDLTATGSRHDRYPDRAPTGTGDSSESRDTAAPPSFSSVCISRPPWPVASQYQSASLAVRMPKSKRSTVATWLGLGLGLGLGLSSPEPAPERKPQP